MVFGTKSKERLGTCHEDLQLIANEVIKITPIDFSITEGHRLIERQQELYKKGRKQVGDDWIIVDKKKVVTNIDGVNRLGKHNENPSMALDFCAYVPAMKKLAYDEMHLSFIAGIFIATSKRLFVEGKIKHILRWGGNWDNDGIIVYDHKLADMPHVELVKPKL